MSARNVLLYVASIVVLAGISGCGSTRPDYERAKAADSIEAWETFLAAHPRSQYNGEVSARVTQLREEATRKEEEQRRESSAYNDTAIKRLQGYRVGVTSTMNLLWDGWNCVDAYKGKMGILAYADKGQGITIPIGIACPAGAVDSDTLEMVSDTEKFVLVGMGRRFFNSTWDGSTVRTKGGGLVKPLRVCTLNFKDRVLDSIVWVVPPDTAHDAIVNYCKTK
jgi:hypothetical protein